MGNFIEGWFILSYIFWFMPVALSWGCSSPRTAARVTLLYPLAPITLPLLVAGSITYGIYFVIRTAIDGSTKESSGGCGSW